MNKLLFHPKVTLAAGLTAIASFCTMFAGLNGPLAKILHSADRADSVVAYAALIGAFSTFFATYGRSPASAVDNNVPPPTNGGNVVKLKDAA